MGRNPFGDDSDATRPPDPFGDPRPTRPDADAADAPAALQHAAARIRRLKQQVSADGLTLSATRELIDHVSSALDAAAEAIRRLEARD